MPRIIYFIIVCVVAVTAVTVISITGVDAYEGTKFVQVSVLARDQADYGVDDHPLTIAAVSPGIIEDKVRDIESDLVTEIPYTVLPPRNSEPAGEGNGQPQSKENAEVHNNYGNDGSSVSNQNQNNNGSSVSNQNQNNNQINKGKSKDKNKDKNKDKGNSGNSGGGGGNKTSEKSSGNSGGSDNGKASEKSSGNSNGNGNGNGNNK